MRLIRRGLVALMLALAWSDPAGAGSVGAAVAVEEPVAEVGVLPVILTGPVAPEVGDAQQRLQARVHEVFPEADTLLGTPTSGSACTDAVCWQALAREHGVAHLLMIEVAFEDPDVRVTARLVDGRSGEALGRTSEVCELCGIVELESMVGDLTSAMRRELEAGIESPPRLQIGSSPAGATVRLDGEVVGVTPLTVVTVPGPHRVEIEHEGFVTERRELSLVEGVERSVEASLRRVPSSTDAPRRDARLPAWIGLGATGIGLGVVGGGIAMILIHGDPILSDCEGDNVDALGRCRFLRNTRAGGIAMVVSGGVLVAAGVVAFGVSLRRRRAQRVAFGPGGVSVRF